MGFQAPNYFQIPNEVVDQYLKVLTHVELKVMMIIIRKTKGWDKDDDWISLGQLEKITGSSRSSVVRAIKGLQKHDLINKKTEGKIGDQQTRFSVKFNKGTSSIIEPPTSSIIEPPTGSTIEPTKDIYTKDTYTKVTPIVPKKGTKEISPEVENLKKKILETIKMKKPNFTRTISKKWDEDCKALLKSRSEEEILNVLNWALNDSFWKSNVLSPGGLKRNLDTIESKMPKNILGRSSCQNQSCHKSRETTSKTEISGQDTKAQVLPPPGLLQKMLEESQIG